MQPYPNQSRHALPGIPFSRVHTTNLELEYVRQAIASGQIAGDGPFTKRCQQWLQDYVGGLKVLLTHSGTAALEMAILLADIQPGDEVIMPSYTFVSTANAVVLRGGIPVFVDIRSDTLNLDEDKIEVAITAKTKAIIPVHYGGVSCNLDAIMAIAHRHGLLVIEDAAQGMYAGYNHQKLGGIGHMAALSFHQTKNIVSGEGGALVINDPAFLERAEIVWEKGTNRSQFFRGEVDKYTWVDIGSSYLPSDILAALLFAQLERAQDITAQRLEIWNAYHARFAPLESRGDVRRPTVPNDCQHNAHIYYVMVWDLEVRSQILSELKQHGVQGTFHYVPLHSAPAGRKYGRVSGDLGNTEALSDRIVRLPLYVGMTESDVDRIVAIVSSVLDDNFEAFGSPMSKRIDEY
jgi:dTDP-4-amino-4,6-dideoxygalactose transaminase